MRKNFVPFAKTLNVIVLASLCLGSCVENSKEPTPINKYLKCGTASFTDSTNFKLYLPNAYTPDSDFVDDYFRIDCVDSTSNVMCVTDLIAVDYLGDTVYQMDSMFNFSTGLQKRWDFNYSSGEVVLGTIDLTFTVTDLKGKTYHVEHRLCSYTCQDIQKNGVNLNRSNLKHEQELNCKKGFVLKPNTIEGCD